eukprot:7379187-Prymnesium_polylepis.1
MEKTIEPTFDWLQGCSKIYPASGPQFGRERVAKMALTALVQSKELPTVSNSLASMEAKMT